MDLGLSLIKINQRLSLITHLCVIGSSYYVVASIGSDIISEIARLSCPACDLIDLLCGACGVLRVTC